MIPVTVLIPIGPQKEYLEWLPEAIESIFQQSILPGEILLVDDMGFEKYPAVSYIDVRKYFPAGLKYFGVDSGNKESYVFENGPEVWVSRWKAPWNIGFAQAFNCGVGVSLYNNIIYLAADDKLMPSCVKDCMDTWRVNQEKDAWYALTYQLQDGEVRSIPINAAMITRSLWKAMGGFPPSAFAGPDALMLSRLMVHAPERIIKVAEGKPNYWIRQHANQETGRQASFFLTEMDSIRNKETARFQFNPEVVLK